MWNNNRHFLITLPAKLPSTTRKLHESGHSEAVAKSFFFNLNLWVHNEMIAICMWQRVTSMNCIAGRVWNADNIENQQTLSHGCQTPTIIIALYIYTERNKTFALDEPTEKVEHWRDKSRAHTKKKNGNTDTNNAFERCYSKTHLIWTKCNRLSLLTNCEFRIQLYLSSLNFIMSTENW